MTSWPPCITCQGQGEIASRDTDHLPANHPNLHLLVCSDCGGTGDDEHYDEEF